MTRGEGPAGMRLIFGSACSNTPACTRAHPRGEAPRGPADAHLLPAPYDSDAHLSPRPVRFGRRLSPRPVPIGRTSLPPRARARACSRRRSSASASSSRRSSSSARASRTACTRRRACVSASAAPPSTPLPVPLCRAVPSRRRARGCGMKLHAARRQHEAGAVHGGPVRIRAPRRRAAASARGREEGGTSSWVTSAARPTRSASMACDTRSPCPCVPRALAA